VLHKVTVPSIIVNMQRRHLSYPPNCRLFCGDWDGLIKAIANSTKYYCCYAINGV